MTDISSVKTIFIINKKKHLDINLHDNHYLYDCTEYQLEMLPSEMYALAPVLY